MFGLSTLGLIHTLVALVALGAGFFALFTAREITASSRVGQVYVMTTLITAASALGIFAHGGAGPGHALAVLTLLALALGAIASMTKTFGGASRVVAAVAFSVTMLFHLIPGVTETLTRLPVTAPTFPSPEAPPLKAVLGLVLVAFVVGVTLQVRWLRRQPKA